MKLLIVDDEEDLRVILRFCLEKIGGMVVLEASNGPDALALAAREKPDAVLLDIMMPGMDGTEVLAALRKDDALKGVPVVFLTAKTTERELQHFRGLGAAGILSKPFDPLTLAEKIRQILRL